MPFIKSTESTRESRLINKKHACLFQNPWLVSAIVFFFPPSVFIVIELQSVLKKLIHPDYGLGK